MKVRQKKLFIILLENEGPHLVSELASELNCSEKTVRNDLVTIAQFVEKKTDGVLIKKPGLGVYLDVKADERKRLYQAFSSDEHEKVETSEEQRRVEIAYELLMTRDSISIQSLSTNYFINRSVIKKDLEFLKHWLEGFGLALYFRQKIGLVIVGNEMARRKALANLGSLVHDEYSVNQFLRKQFSAYEVSLVENELKAHQTKHSISYTDEAEENLLLHTLFTIKRVKLKQEIKLSAQDLDQIKSTSEFGWARELLKKLEIVFVVHFPEEEIAYLALHFIGAKRRYIESNPLVEQKSDVERFGRELIERMAELTSFAFDRDETLLEGLRVHLYAALNRIEYGLSVSNPMLQEIKRMYPYLFDLLLQITSNQREKYGVEIPEDEIAYLTLHFEAAVERLNSNRGKKKRAVIVCHLGVGMSQLLRSKLERKFASLTILDCISRADLSAFLKIEDVDLIITTVHLEASSAVPHIVISPLLNTEEESKLETFIEKLDESKRTERRSTIFSSYLKPELIFVQHEGIHRFKVIEELSMALSKNGYVEENYAHTALIRERASSTAIGSGISIPHGDPNLITKSAIALAIMKEPLPWGDEKVSLVFLLAVKNDASDNTRALFRELSAISEKPFFLKELMSQSDPQSVINLLGVSNSVK